MKRVVIAPTASADIDDAWHYLAMEADEMDAANNLRNKLREQIWQLSQFPGIGHYRTDLAEPPIRFIKVYSHLIVYAEEGDFIHVFRILHQSRDIEKILKKGH